MKRLIIIFILAAFFTGSLTAQNVRKIRGDTLIIRNGGRFGGIVDMNGNKIINLDTATNPLDAVPFFQIQAFIGNSIIDIDYSNPSMVKHTNSDSTFFYKSMAHGHLENLLVTQFAFPDNYVLIGTGPGVEATDGFQYDGSKATLAGNLIFEDPGTNVNSYFIELPADQAGLQQSSFLQTIRGDDPYFNIKVSQDDGATVQLMKAFDQKIEWFDDEADVDYAMIWLGESNDDSLIYMEDEGQHVFTGELSAKGGFITIVSTLDVSNPPLDAELDAEFGTPASVGAGWSIYIDDNGGGANFYQVASDGTNYWIFTGAKAL